MSLSVTTYPDFKVGDRVLLRGYAFHSCRGSFAVVLWAENSSLDGVRHGRAKCDHCGGSHGFHNDSRADMYQAEPVTTPDEATVTFQDEDYLVIINGAKMKEDMRNFVNVHRKHGWIPNETLLYPNIADTHVEMFCPECQFVYTIKRTVFEMYGG